jgi:predicted Zn-dependent peptidase
MKTRRNKKYIGKTTKRYDSIESIYFYKTPPTISNIDGFKFLFLPIKSQTLQVECKVFGGSYLENKENLGISHLLEHVITDSWKKCYKSGCVKYMEQYGTVNNAYTTNISTGYWIKGLTEFQNVMVEYILSTALDPHIIKQTMDDEIEAVRNEITEYMNHPTYKLQDYTSKVLFKNTGMKYASDYKIQLANLKKFTVEKLINFAHSIISQKRMMFIISGSYKKHKIISVIKNILKRISYNGAFDISANVNLQICYNSQKSIHFVENTKNSNSTIFMEFPLEIYQGDKLLLYIPIITQLMGSGLNSLLLYQLRETDNLVYGINVSSSTNFCGTLISIKISTIDKNVKEVLEKTIYIIKKYSSTLVDTTLLNNYKLRYNLHLREVCKNTTSSVSDFYSFQYFYQMNAKKPKIYTIRDITSVIKNLTRSKVSELIKRLFNFEKCIICYSSKTPVDFTTNDF